MVTIASSVLEDVIAHGRECQPRECCGVLLGTAGEISLNVRGRNTAENPTRFELDPKDHINARRTARSRGLDVVGFYHSHPYSPADPSHTDLAEATYSDCVHLIIGFVAGVPDVRLFRYAQGVASELALVQF